MRPAPDPEPARDPAVLDRAAVRAEMDQARTGFRRLTSDAAPADLRRPPDGTRRTSQQLLFHVLSGYLIVRTLPGLVRISGLLPDGASKASARLPDSAHYPPTWDPFFGAYMTQAAICRYPTRHFRFRQRQLTLSPPRGQPAAAA